MGGYNYSCPNPNWRAGLLEMELEYGLIFCHKCAFHKDRTQGIYFG